MDKWIKWLIEKQSIINVIIIFSGCLTAAYLFFVSGIYYGFLLVIGTFMMLVSYRLWVASIVEEPIDSRQEGDEKNV